MTWGKKKKTHNDLVNVDPVWDMDNKLKNSISAGTQTSYLEKFNIFHSVACKSNEKLFKPDPKDRDSKKGFTTTRVVNDVTTLTNPADPAHSIICTLQTSHWHIQLDVLVASR